MKLFTASWCNPCTVVKQELDKFPNTVEVVDIESDVALTRALGVRSVPSLVLGSGEVVTGVEAIVNKLREAYGQA